MTGAENGAGTHFCHPPNCLMGASQRSNATVTIESAFLPEASPNLPAAFFKVKMKNETKRIFYSCFAHCFFRCVPVQNGVYIKRILENVGCCQSSLPNTENQWFAKKSSLKMRKKDYFFFIWRVKENNAGWSVLLLLTYSRSLTKDNSQKFVSRGSAAKKRPVRVNLVLAKHHFDDIPSRKH